MKNCFYAFLYAITLLTLARIGSDVVKEHLPGATQEFFIGLSSDWSEESEETEEDSSLEDDFATGTSEPTLSLKYSSPWGAISDYSFFKDHITEVVPPPPQV